MKLTFRPPRAIAVIVAAGLLVAAITSVNSAAATAPPTDEQKAADAGVDGAAIDSGYASSLAEESHFAAQALAEDVSPGAYAVGGLLVSRVFAGASTPDGRTTFLSRFTRASFEKLQAEVAGLAGRKGVFFSISYDAKNDSVVVTGNLDRSELPQAELRSGALTFEYTEDGGRESRSNDALPHWGGAKISGPSVCSSGFIVRNSAGTRFALTAGHCGAVGSNWVSGSFAFGKMTKRGAFPTYDMALIGGSTYGTEIWMGNATGVPAQTNTAADPAVATSYCTSGIATNENCSKTVTSVNAKFCDTSGCTIALAEYSGGTLTAAGDSGGPLVLKAGAKVHPRGMHIARVGTKMYAEKWSIISAHLGMISVPS